tara:strand:+ start:628 stop:1041 length:414 start_codon:yes stop_codon:yes gene_type:complete
MEINPQITDLKKIKCDGGRILHILSKSSSKFKDFGEAYFNIINPSVIKGWNMHLKGTCNIVVPKGEIKFVIKQNNNFFVEIISEKSYKLLTIPPKNWFAFQNLSSEQSIILNIFSIEHDPMELQKLTLNKINFDWSL